LREWAYGIHWPDSEQRNLALAPWTDYYNFERPHGSLQYQPPISRSEPGTTS
ncbi:MAG: integrase core domain-containing protein, partial [Terriglobales bacterium]